jgi:UDP-N-acetylmuramoylalanine--D-glutamate ligase
MVGTKDKKVKYQLQNKRVTIIGLSRTGVATARVLAKKGARVTVSDVKGAANLKEELARLADLPLEYELEGHGEKALQADLIVVSPGVPLGIPFFQKAREQGIPIISEIELAYHLTEARIIAITGTNGKTTTTGLTGEILKKARPGLVKVAGNIGTPLIQEATGLTEGDWVVAEISSFQLETIEDFHPYISVYLNFTPDHLDRHRTVENYWEAKKKIFVNQTEKDYAVINLDDPEVVRAAEDCRALKYYISINQEVERGIFLRGEKLVLRDDSFTQELISINDIPLIGMHNIQNVAFACLTAYLTGVEIELMKEVIQEFKPDHHRLEEVARDNDGTIYIDDSKATNPDAAIKGISSFQQPIVLIAGGQDRDADFNELVEVINEKVRVLVLLGETKYKLRDQALKQGFDNINIHVVENMEQAVETAFDMLQPGECLLLSPGCPSWDMYSSYKERGKEFQTAVQKLRGN